MTRTITAFYATRAQADAARAALNEEAGVDSSRIQLFDGGVGGPGDNSTLGGGKDQDLFENLTRMFLPSEEADAHHRRLGEGGVLLCAEVEEAQFDDAMRLIERSDGLDAHCGSERDAGGTRVRSYARNTMRG